MNTKKMWEEFEEWYRRDFEIEQGFILTDDIEVNWDNDYIQRDYRVWQAARAGGDGRSWEEKLDDAIDEYEMTDGDGTYYEPNRFERTLIKDFIMGCELLDSPAPAAKVPEITIAGRRFLAATEKLADWLNGCDISADHADRCPEDFSELCDAMVDFRAALSAAPTPEQE